jgi:Tfp pilus assembly protein PilF
MKRPFSALSLVVFATIPSSCTTSKQVEIRPLGTVSVRVASTSVFEAEGQAHLALGDAGLALESFRRAVTQQPDNVAALRGIAAAYEMMGRPDLSRPMFERALALAPRDTVTLTALASSMTDDGQLAQAAEVRREIASAGAGAGRSHSPPPPRSRRPHRRQQAPGSSASRSAKSRW